MAAVRTNLCTNPSAEVNTTGWATATFASAGTVAVTRVADTVPTGGGSYAFNLASTALAAGTSNIAQAEASAVAAAGQRHAFSAQIRFVAGSAPAGATAKLRIEYKNGVTSLAIVSSATIPATQLTYAPLSVVSASAPVGTTHVYMQVQILGGTSAGAAAARFDMVLGEIGTVVGTYFDGASPYSVWSGTAHASTSVETIGGITLEALPGDPRPVGITVDALVPSAPSVVTVWRSSPGGKRRAVRGFRRRTVVGADYVTDFEVPLGRTVTYELEVHSGAWVPFALSGQVTIDSTVGYVQDPLVPGTAVAIERVDAKAGPVLAAPSFRNLVNSIGMSVTAILGSDEPVALAGQRLANADVEFTLVTDAAEVSTALRTVLRTAFPVCIRPLPSWGPLPDVIYLAPPDIIERPLGAVLGGTLTRWACGGDTVAPPSMSILVPIWSYADVEALYATYSDAQARATSRGLTYLDDLKDPTLGGP